MRGRKGWWEGEREREVDLFLFSRSTLLRYNSHPIQFTHLKRTVQWFLTRAQSCTDIAMSSLRSHPRGPQQSPPISSSPLSRPLQLLISFPSKWICQFWTLWANNIIQYRWFLLQQHQVHESSLLQGLVQCRPRLLCVYRGPRGFLLAF